MIPSTEALERLREGNRRHVADVRRRSTLPTRTRRSELVRGQEPFAVVLGCADSRVPPELVFDQTLGDLFVVRVAGNVTPPSVVGSVEFAVDLLGTRLVVVLGHSGCGAVQATLDAIEGPAADLSPGLRSLVEGIRPAVEPLLEAGDPGAEPEADRAALVERAVRANVRASAEHLRRGSEILARRIEEDGLRVVGAEYSLETGAVDLFDAPPATG